MKTPTCPDIQTGPVPGEAQFGGSGGSFAADDPPPAFPRVPGETPRAFSAFMTWFQLGHTRSLAAVAEKLGESTGTVKNWSSKHGWAERLQAYQSGLLQEQARQHSACCLEQAADWNRRLAAFREQEWDAAQKLIAVAQCFLETCGEEVRRGGDLPHKASLLMSAELANTKAPRAPHSLAGDHSCPNSQPTSHTAEVCRSYADRWQSVSSRWSGYPGWDDALSPRFTVWQIAPSNSISNLLVLG